MASVPSNSTRSTVDIESIRLYFSTLAARVKTDVSLETIRPLPVFLGIRSTRDDGLQLSEGAFTPPSLTGADSMTKIKQRVKENWTFFLSNYALVAAMTAIVVLLMHPSVVITLAMLYGLWWVHGYLIVKELTFLSVPIHAILTVQQRFYLLFGISAVVIIWTCLVPAVIFVVISGIIIFSHAAVRDTTHLHEASQRGNQHREDAILGGGIDSVNADHDGDKKEVDALLSKV